MAKVKSQAQKLKDPSGNTARDFDPEDEGAYRSASEESDSEDDAAPAAARDHYETVGKSKLRKSDSVSLGPQYSGRRVDRDALDDDDDEDDPFNREYSDSDSDSDSDSEDENDVVDFSEDDVGDAAANDTGSSSEEEDEANEEDTDITDEDDMDIDDGDAFDNARSTNHIQNSAEIRKLMADDLKKVAASLSQSTKDNEDKGRAVKKQRATFDGLLNSRIKLQKALVATNSMLAADREDGSNAEEAIEAAETAALRLWNNLNALRASLQDGMSTQKRSHAEFTREDSLDAMWEDTKVNEAAQKKQRTAALDKWARTTRATTALPQARGRLQQPVKEQQLSDVLAGQMADMSRLVAKTQVPRSCAPVQAAAASKKTPKTIGVHADEVDAASDDVLPIYDDADFYTTLLSNLISQRSADTAVSLSSLSLQPWQAAREAKTKKVVDTKASKGRKLRYTVHEKLVSFMAPEDRGEWPEAKAEDFFMTLLGRRVGLDEAVHEADDEEDKEVEGLRLFGGK